jgi:hypothetical protein
MNIQFDNNSEEEINDLNEIANYVLLLKQNNNNNNNNQNINESVSVKQANDDTNNQLSENYLTNNVSQSFKICV